MVKEAGGQVLKLKEHLSQEGMTLGFCRAVFREAVLGRYGWRDLGKYSRRLRAEAYQEGIGDQKLFLAMIKGCFDGFGERCHFLNPER